MTSCRWIPSGEDDEPEPGESGQTVLRCPAQIPADLIHCDQIPSGQMPVIVSTPTGPVGYSRKLSVTS